MAEDAQGRSLMSASRCTPCPAHAAYGIAVALALGLGLFAGITFCWATPGAPGTPAAGAAGNEPLPVNFPQRFDNLEKNACDLVKRQALMLKRMVPDEEWNHTPAPAAGR
jgi:hypothetical protein